MAKTRVVKYFTRPARPRVLGSKTTGLLETKEPRQYDIEFEGPRRDTDVFEITPPEGYEVDELPPPVDEEHPFAAYHSKTESVGRTLKYGRTFEVKSVSGPVAHADELKAFYGVILNDERMPAVLKKVARQRALKLYLRPQAQLGPHGTSISMPQPARPGS